MLSYHFVGIENGNGGVLILRSKEEEPIIWRTCSFS
jgi:hypothetical protein